MKKLTLFSMVAAFFGFAGFVGAAGPTVQDIGSVSTGTAFSISVGVVPTLAISTGSNVVMSNTNAQPFFINQGTSTLPVMGDYLPGRIHLEFANFTGQSVWLGYDVNLTTFAGRNCGREIPHGTTWSTNSSIWNYYVRASSATSVKFTVTQER